MNSIKYIFTILLAFSLKFGYAQERNSFQAIKNKDDSLIMIYEERMNELRYGYINQKGDTIIPFGKYLVCFTDNFKCCAIVLDKKEGLIAIDRNENILYRVFAEDYEEEIYDDGVFRVIEDGKIGYADLDGNLIIKPQFKCARWFVNGKARVSNDCTIEKKGRITHFRDAQWFYIDKQGNVIK